MIGDIHGGSNGVTEEKLREWSRKSTNRILMSSSCSAIMFRRFSRAPAGRNLRMPAETIAANLAGIRRDHGVFVVLGNHDGGYGDDTVATAVYAGRL